MGGPAAAALQAASMAGSGGGWASVTARQIKWQQGWEEYVVGIRGVAGEGSDGLTAQWQRWQPSLH